MGTTTRIGRINGAAGGKTQRTCQLFLDKKSIFQGGWYAGCHQNTLAWPTTRPLTPKKFILLNTVSKQYNNPVKEG